MLGLPFKNQAFLVFAKGENLNYPGSRFDCVCLCVCVCVVVTPEACASPPSQGLNSHHSSDLSHCNDNTRSLTARLPGNSKFALTGVLVML